MDDLISKQEAIDRLSEVLSNEREFENAKQVLIEAPTLDEKEIIRKAFERVVERLEEERQYHLLDRDFNFALRRDNVFRIVKEEGGIE